MENAYNAEFLVDKNEIISQEISKNKQYKIKRKNAN